MSRASENDVRDVISFNPELPLPDMSPYIRTAATLVDKVESNDSSSLMDNADLKEVEIYLAAHCYAHKDLQFTKSKAGESFAEFQTGTPGKGFLDSTMWGRMAVGLDETGYLAKLNKQSINGKFTLTVSWLGKPPSTQIDYVDRD